MCSGHSHKPLFIVIFAGGFTTKFIWCIIISGRDLSLGDYINGGGAALLVNYKFSVMVGITWHLQFIFYGMGTTQMGKYDFSSWTIHMAFIIFFSNI